MSQRPSNKITPERVRSLNEKMELLNSVKLAYDLELKKIKRRQRNRMLGDAFLLACMGAVLFWLYMTGKFS